MKMFAVPTKFEQHVTCPSTQFWFCKEDEVLDLKVCADRVSNLTNTLRFKTGKLFFLLATATPAAIHTSNLLVGTCHDGCSRVSPFLFVLFF